MHTRDLLQQAVFAVAAVVSGVLVALVPALAQPQANVTPANVTQVRYPGGQFDKTGPTSWVAKHHGGSFSYVEKSRSATSVTLTGPAKDETVEINLPEKKVKSFVSGKPSGSESLTDVYGISADDSADTCKQQPSGVKCTCDLRVLRPLQGAVGLDEVMEKKDEIIKRSMGKDPERARRELAYDPIKVVAGPGGALFVTDHHHGARAWLEAGQKMGTCAIQDALPVDTDASFRAELEKKNLVRLANQDGVVIKWEELPKTLKALPDDPYRTLAWLVRKKPNYGYCRALMAGHTEFAEFKWADWMRGKPELPPAEVKASPWKMLPAALKLAEGPLATSLPGYRTLRLPRGKFPDACPAAAGELALN
jgi:hypothetical protein